MCTCVSIGESSRPEGGGAPAGTPPQRARARMTPGRIAQHAALGVQASGALTGRSSRARSSRLVHSSGRSPSAIDYLRSLARGTGKRCRDVLHGTAKFSRGMKGWFGDEGFAWCRDDVGQGQATKDTPEREVLEVWQGGSAAPGDTRRGPAVLDLLRRGGRVGSPLPARRLGRGPRRGGGEKRGPLGGQDRAEVRTFTR